MQHSMRWLTTSLICYERFVPVVGGAFHYNLFGHFRSFPVISGRPEMTAFIFRRLYNFILSLHSDLRFNLSFPSVFIL